MSNVKKESRAENTETINWTMVLVVITYLLALGFTVIKGIKDIVNSIVTNGNTVLTIIMSISIFFVVDSAFLLTYTAIAYFVYKTANESNEETKE